MYAATACPGPYLISKIDYIIQEANKIINNGSDVIVTRTPVNMSYQVYDGAWLPNVTGHNQNDHNNGYEYNKSYNTESAKESNIDNHIQSKANHINDKNKLSNKNYYTESDKEHYHKNNYQNKNK